MKIVSLFVVIGLMALPPILIVATAIFDAVLDSTKRLTGNEKSPGSPGKLRLTKFKRLRYAFAAIYFLLLVASILWTISLYAGDFGVPARRIIAFGAFGVFFIGFIAFIGIWRYRQIVKKYPRPSVDIGSREYLEWQNRFSDENSKRMGFHILIFAGLGVLAAVLFAVAFAYFHL
jgi:drug/metabolite transporter (DMT)-like permease